VATTYTANARLQKPSTTDRNWDVPLNANADYLDGLSAVGRLAVTPTEAPSATLNVAVTGGAYAAANGTTGAFAGVPSYALPASSTSYLWLTDAGVLTATPAFPASAHVRLAHVVTGASAVLAVVDERVVARTCGTGLGFVLKAGDTVAGPFAVTPTGAGGVAALAVGLSNAAPAVGFFGATPAAQAPAIAPLLDHSTGAASNTVNDVGGSFSQSQVDGNFATLAAKVNALIAALKLFGLMSN